MISSFVHRCFEVSPIDIVSHMLSYISGILLLQRTPLRFPNDDSPLFKWVSEVITFGHLTQQAIWLIQTMRMTVTELSSEICVLFSVIYIFIPFVGPCANLKTVVSNSSFYSRPWRALRILGSLSNWVNHPCWSCFILLLLQLETSRYCQVKFHSIESTLRKSRRSLGSKYMSQILKHWNKFIISLTT